MRSIVTVIIFLTRQVNGQYGELASLIGGALTPGIVGNGANGASDLLGNIGTLYKIAQGALQLTGTGVGILNQAAEGKWFNTILEEAKNFGINFPAPAPSDYDHEEITKLEGLIPFSANNITTETTKPTETSLITLFPEESGVSSLMEKEDRSSINTIEDNETEEVIDHSGNKENVGIKEFNEYDHVKEQTDKKLESIEKKIPKLQRFIALLHESNITENDLNELTQLLEREKAIKLKSTKSKTTSRILYTTPTGTITTDSTFQHTEETSKSFLSTPPIILRPIGSVGITDNEDNDLLPPTTPRSRARAVRIKYRPHSGSKIDSMFTTFHRPRKFPRRIAYRARLPFITNTAHINMGKSEQSEININKRVIPPIHLTDQNSNILRQPFFQHTVQNPFEQSKISLTAPIFGIFQTPAFTTPTYQQTVNAIPFATTIYPQTMNVIKSQPSSYTTILENPNKNNRLWANQERTYILGQPNIHFNSNSDLFLYNQNPS
ncbi:hypothetical protein ACH3XW_33775 [Acanthocheilonema viteae]